MIIAAGSYPVAIVDGAVVIATPNQSDDTKIEKITFADQRHIWESTVDSDRYIGSASAGVLLLGGSTQLGRVDPGLVQVDLSDGSSRVFLKSTDAPGNAAGWTRSILVSVTGRSVFTSLCGPDGGCSNAVLAGGTGDLIRDLPGTTPVVLANDDLAMTYDGNTATGLDLATGKVVWRQSAQYGGGYLVGDRSFVAGWTSQDGVTFTIEVTDLLTGTAHVVFERPSSEDWTLWPEFSTAAFAAIGHGGRLTDVALAGNPIVASTVDLGSGTLTDTAIQIADGNE